MKRNMSCIILLRGQDDVPDYLAISFSSTDYVGHIFGASTLRVCPSLVPVSGQIVADASGGTAGLATTPATTPCTVNAPDISSNDVNNRAF